jgi:hypothetical protein
MTDYVKHKERRYCSTCTYRLRCVVMYVACRWRQWVPVKRWLNFYQTIQRHISEDVNLLLPSVCCSWNPGLDPGLVSIFGRGSAPSFRKPVQALRWHNGEPPLTCLLASSDTALLCRLIRIALGTRDLRFCPILPPRAFPVWLHNIPITQTHKNETSEISRPWYIPSSVNPFSNTPALIVWRCLCKIFTRNL